MSKYVYELITFYSITFRITIIKRISLGASKYVISNVAILVQSFLFIDEIKVILRHIAKVPVRTHRRFVLASVKVAIPECNHSSSKVFLSLLFFYALSIFFSSVWQADST